MNIFASIKKILFSKELLQKDLRSLLAPRFRSQNLVLDRKGKVSLILAYFALNVLTKYLHVQRYSTKSVKTLPKSRIRAGFKTLSIFNILKHGGSSLDFYLQIHKNSCDNIYVYIIYYTVL